MEAKLDSPKVWSELGLYIIFAFELIVSIIAPGMITVYLLVLLDPALLQLSLFPAALADARTPIAIIGVTMIGLVAGRIGDILLRAVNLVIPFGQRVEDSFLASYIDAQIGSFDLPEYLKQLAPAQLAEFQRYSDEQRRAYFAQLFTSMREATKLEYHRRINLGLTFAPKLIGHHSAGRHRQELRAFISVPESMLSFVRGALPVVLLSAVLLPLRLAAGPTRIAAFAAGLCALILWFDIAIRTYAYYRGAQLHLWVGLGQSGLPPLA